MIDPIQLPHKQLENALQRSKKLQAIFDGKKSFETTSERDLSIANLLAIKGWEPNKIASVLYHFRTANGDRLKHPKYQVTVAKAVAWAEEEKKNELGKDQAEIEALKRMMAEKTKKDSLKQSGSANLENPLFQKKHVINTTNQPLHVLSKQAWDMH